MGGQNGLSVDDISVKFITLALRKAGWDETMQIRRQVSSTNDSVIERRQLDSRHIPLALTAAKKAIFVKAHGTQQALDCAAPLDIPFVSAGNSEVSAFNDKTGRGNLGEVHRRSMPTPHPSSSGASARHWKG